MADINYEIVEEIGVLSTTSSGWKKELNFISFLRVTEGAKTDNTTKNNHDP